MFEGGEPQRRDLADGGLADGDLANGTVADIGCLDAHLDELLSLFGELRPHPPQFSHARKRYHGLLLESVHAIEFVADEIDFVVLRRDHHLQRLRFLQTQDGDFESRHAHPDAPQLCSDLRPNGLSTRGRCAPLSREDPWTRILWITRDGYDIGVRIFIPTGAPFF